MLKKNIEVMERSQEVELCHARETPASAGEGKDYVRDLERLRLSPITHDCHRSVMGANKAILLRPTGLVIITAIDSGHAIHALS